jgi:hypothetical protein
MSLVSAVVIMVRQDRGGYSGTEAVGVDKTVGDAFEHPEFGVGAYEPVVGKQVCIVEGEYPKYVIGSWMMRD